MFIRLVKGRVVRKADQVVVVVVTSPVKLLAVTLILAWAMNAHAAVIPEDRTDILYHSYDGGGVTITGPSILVRKGDEKSFSVFGNYYVDNITSASIDVEVSGASEYTESRTEHSLGFDYVRDKTTMSFAYTSSSENDFEAKSAHFNVSQDMFGDMTTISIGFSQGDDTVRSSIDETFEEYADRKNYRVGLTQVLTKDLIMNLSHETITDEGFLNNPYRSIRFVDDPTADVLTYSFDNEVYPNTRTSNSNAIRMRYFLPYRAALHFEYRVFEDTWGINATTTEFGYTHPFGDQWIFDITYRLYDQTKADFYSDLFPYQDAQNFMARDKELSTFNSNTIGLGVSYEFVQNGWGFVDRGSINLSFDHIQFNYDNFRDLRATGYLTGEEPLYEFSSDVMRFFVSLWY
jgi:hypothetical protein